jgi:hypothetical protein
MVLANASGFVGDGRKATTVIFFMATIAAVHSYTSSQSVKVAHSIPHLNKLLQQQSSDFALTSTLSLGDTYFLSLLTLPILLMVTGFSGLFIFGATLLSRICCTCAINAPNRKEVKEESDEEYAGWAKRTTKCKRLLLISFVTFLMLAFSSTQIGWYGYTRFDAGISGLTKSYDSLLDTFSSLQIQGEPLSILFRCNCSAHSILCVIFKECLDKLTR